MWRGKQLDQYRMWCTVSKKISGHSAENVPLTTNQPYLERERSLDSAHTRSYPSMVCWTRCNRSCNNKISLFVLLTFMPDRQNLLSRLEFYPRLNRAVWVLWAFLFEDPSRIYGAFIFSFGLFAWLRLWVATWVILPKFFQGVNTAIRAQHVFICVCEKNKWKIGKQERKWTEMGAVSLCFWMAGFVWNLWLWRAWSRCNIWERFYNIAAKNWARGSQFKHIHH